MSRIGRLPVVIPQGVTVTVSDNNEVTVKGPKGTLTKQMSKKVNIAVEDGKVIVTRPDDEKETKALHGLTRSLIKNMVIGVTEGYQKTLELVGVGYRAAKQGKKLVLNVGYSHPVEIEPVEGIEFEVPAANQIVVKGIDKELVGQVAARIRSVREPEPYKGKGIKYIDEVIRRKEGKTGKK
ncbi:large subunit ribosomal protein L6 [Caloramator fervidus]|uniref:Large ribosomal subunit protein uL6 n=1 Tax=Caloramator fervidus TaxID=29344 RepID=A0A1H5X721_9CLOT|nr:50S ribosomal protein L6 [Caloramator fervidus]SEG07187.1 large subunit ribosomal protein L6 [Caloramator fervidus]